jgi:tetratricopeptide (TPR) repeat protein
MTAPKKLAICFAALLLVTPLARADTLWIGTKNPIEADGVKILQVTGDQMQYTTADGSQSTKSLSQLPQINIDGKSSFNAAENAFAARDFNTAITNYHAALQTSGEKDWILTRAATRLAQAGKTINRFDAQVDAYAILLQIDPATAAQFKPDEPAAHAPDLDPALADISKALGNSRLADAQKSVLLNLQLQINRAKGDTAGANTTLQQLVAIGGASDSDKAMLKLAAVATAVDAKQYSDAISSIEQNRALYTEPDQQVEALYLLAKARQGNDGSKTDPDTLKDQAIAYMRVVTFGSQLPNRPHVADSLYQTGLIEEKLKEPKAALPLYEQIVRDKAYANSPVLPLAQAAIDRLAKESSASK